MGQKVGVGFVVF